MSGRNLNELHPSCCPYASPIFEVEKNFYYCIKKAKFIKMKERPINTNPRMYHLPRNTQIKIFGCTHKLQYDHRYLECPLYKKAIFPIEEDVSDYYSLEKMEEEGEDMYDVWTTTISGIPMAWKNKKKKIGDLIL